MEDFCEHRTEAKFEITFGFRTGKRFLSLRDRDRTPHREVDGIQAAAPRWALRVPAR
jgi:hypothetical protein